MTLEGKTALVTGAGRGIGKACAMALSSSGAKLILNDRSGSSEVLDTADAIRSRGAECLVIQEDIFCSEARKRLVANAIAEFASIDIFVSCPALNIKRPFLELDIVDFERIMSATLVSGFHLSQLVASSMVSEGRGGKIIFISSAHAELPIAHNIAYGAAKAGLNQMTRTISVELAPHRINVNAVQPGWIDTPGERKLWSDDTIEEGSKMLPWKRLGEPGDIANAVEFLASNAADYITGAVIPVDGGYRYKDCATPA